MHYDDLRNEILGIANQTIKWAKDFHIPSAEVYVLKQGLLTMSDNKGKIDTRTGIVSGVGIRCAIDKKVGFSSCTGFTEEAIKSSLKQAHKIAKHSPDDPLFPGFVTENTRGKEGVLDSKLLSISPEDLAQQCDLMVKDVKRDDERIVGLTLGVNAGWQGYAVATTEGCLQSTLKSVHAADCGVVVMQKGDRKTSREYKIGRTAQDVTNIGVSAVENALDSLGSKPLGESLSLPLILHPRTASTVIGLAFTVALNGSMYVEKRSPLQDKLGKKIAVEDLTIVDNGQKHELISTEAIDAEGSPMRNTPVVENGVLKTFLFNRKFGLAVDKDTTGNASRGGMMGGIPFESVPAISPNKFIIDLGTKNLEKQIEEIDNGIYVEGSPIGLHTSNFLTGDFSITSNNAYWIEKGEKKYPLKNLSIAGNFFEVFNKINCIGNDPLPTYGPMDSPALTIDHVSFSS